MAITITLTADAASVDAALSRLQGAIDQRMTAIERRMDASARETQQFAERSARHLAQLERSFTSLKTVVTRITGILATFGVGLSLGSVVRDALQTAGAFEQLDTSLRFVTSSMAEFTAAKQFILDFTTTTQFQLGQVSQGFIDLQRRGFDVQRTLKAVADTASGAQFPTQAFNQIIYALTNIADKGRLMGEELIRQLSPVGIQVERVRQELAKMGIVLEQDIGRSSIPAKQAIEAITRVMEQDFGGAIQAALNNFNTLMSNLTDAWHILQDTIVRGPLFDWLKAVAALLLDDINRAIKEDDALFRSWGQAAVLWLEAIGKGIATAIDYLRLVDAVLAKIMTYVQPMIDWLDTIVYALANGVIAAVRLVVEALDRGMLATVRSIGEEISTKVVAALEAVVTAIRDRVTAALHAVHQQVLGIIRSILEAVGMLERSTSGGGAYLESLKQGQVTLEEVNRLMREQGALLEQGSVRIGEMTEGLQAQKEHTAQTTQQTDELLQTYQSGKAAAAEVGNELERWGKALGVNLTETRKGWETFLQSVHERSRQMNEERDKALAAAQQRNAQQQRQLASQMTGGGEAARATANAAKAQEQIIQQSLKRQEALIAQSFDERRAEADAFFAEQIRQAPGEAREIEQARIGAMREIAQEQATILERVRLDANDRLLAATVDHLQKEKAAHAGNVAEIATIEGSLLQAYEAHGARQEDIFAKTAQVRMRLSKEATDAEIKEIIRQQELLEQSREQGLEDFAKQTRRLQEDLARQQEQLQASQLRSYENFVTRVASILDQMFTGLLDGTLNAVDFFKTLLISALSSIASTVLTQFIAPIIAQIAASITGSFTSLLPQALAGVVTSGIGIPAGVPAGATTAQGVLQLLGLQSLFGPQGVLGGAITFLTDSLNTAALQVGRWAVETFGIPIGASGFQVSGLTALGGLAGIGGGIFSAMNAPNAAGQVGGALGAAGGMAALLSGLGLLAPMFGPIGLAVAALMPLIGNWVGGMIKEHGPRLVVDQLQGLAVGFEDGVLRVTGDLSAAVQRQERTSVNVQGLAADLERNLTNVVTGMVDVINQVAVDPEALLGPTQQALQTAMDHVISLNSSNARNMQADLDAQLRFASTQMTSFFLDPLNLAIEQLESADVQTQMARMGPAIAGAAQIFARLNDELDALANVANTDVLRQLSSVRNRVENFGHQLVEAATNIAESLVASVVATGQQAVQEILGRSLEVQALSLAGAFTERLQAAGALQTAISGLGAVGLDFSGLQGQLEALFTSVITDAFAVVDHALATGPFPEALAVILAIPDAVVALNPQLQAFKALAQAFAPLVNTLAQNITQLEQSMQSVDERLAAGRTRMAQLSTAIKEAGLNVSVALPLYDQLRQEILASAQLQIQQIQAIAQAWDAAMGSVQSAIVDLEAESGNVEKQMTRALTDISNAANDFQAAMASGDTLGAINALTEYQEAILALTDLRIQAIQAEREAVIEAYEESIAWIERQMAAIQDQIDAHREQIEVYQEQIDAHREQIDALEQQADAQRDVIQRLEDERQVRQDLVDDLSQQIHAMQGLRQRIGETIRGEASPTAQAEAIRAEMASIQTRLLTLTGQEAIDALQRMVELNEELLGVGESSSQLAVMQEAIRNLHLLWQQIADREAGLTDQLSVAEQQLEQTRQQLTVAQQQLDAIAAQIVLEEAQIEALEALIKGEEAQIEALEDQLKQWDAFLEIKKAELDAILASTYWDEQIANVQTAAYLELLAIEQALLTLQGPTTWEDQILAIQEATLDQLKQMQSALQALYQAAAATYNVGAASANYEQQMTGLLELISQYNLALPLKTVVQNFYDAPGARAQRGGWIHLAHGGMVPIMAESGERIFTPPVPAGVAALNAAIPRFGGGGFTVPGTGSGDTVPLWVPPGSFVLNRHASQALGYQGGGSIQTGRDGDGPQTIHLHVDLRGAHFSDRDDAKKFIRLLEDWSHRRSSSGLR